MEAIQTPALFSAPGNGETTWFQPNRMTVKATAEATASDTRAKVLPRSVDR